ncbi:MAG: Uncharacterized protein G01um10147_54 [Microgenomates group bacterium Gr01-1014_7]|nr:MAG: Uncharacterized protein G01um10147_54 [Microgenomates group bacterium Gr01-1014_7]
MRIFSKINTDTKIIIGLFLSWRTALIIFSLIALNFPLASTSRYLGGGPINFQLSPELFAWANFDGEHFLSIAIFGYNELEQAFFPIFPMIINFFASPFSSNLLISILSSTIVGLIISNTSFFIALILLFELLNLDYSKKISFLTLIVLLCFPTSFYFGALYSESLFLLLSVSSFYLARKGKWIEASLIGAIASSTRVFGIILLPALLFEAWQQKVPFKKIIWLFMIPTGLGIYMIYQYLNFGDPLAFYNLQKEVGEQHQSGIILLPQVYFRYLKMLLTVDMQNPIYQTIILEIMVGITFFLLPIYGYFKKIRLSYLLYAIFGFLLTTVQGSFSSLPRYIIVLFPSFLALAIFVNSLPKFLRVIFLFISCLILFAETTLFLRGYWVA